jgi:uncharacterized protein YaaQ
VTQEEDGEENLPLLGTLKNHFRARRLSSTAGILQAENSGLVGCTENGVTFYFTS